MTAPTRANAPARPAITFLEALLDLSVLLAELEVAVLVWEVSVMNPLEVALEADDLALA